MMGMRTLKARVKNGRLLLNEPTGLAEGTELDLTVVDPGDELDDDEREALHAALRAAWASTRAGDLHPADELLRKLQDRE